MEAWGLHQKILSYSRTITFPCLIPKTHLVVFADLTWKHTLFETSQFWLTEGIRDFCLTSWTILYEKHFSNSTISSYREIKNKLNANFKLVAKNSWIIFVSFRLKFVTSFLNQKRKVRRKIKHVQMKKLMKAKHN